MIVCVFVSAPKLSPPAGIPPITPGSVVIVKRSMTCSSFVMLAMPSGMSMPRFTTLFAINSNAARCAMILRSFKGIGAMELAATRNSLENAVL